MKIFQTAIVLISILISVNQSIADNEQSETLSLDTITVTANKQEENIQEVPMAITVFDEFTIEDKNITSVRDLADYVPNLILTNQGTSTYARPAMRGILAELGSDVSTALFIDGVPVLSGSGYGDPLQDIERIEVLRGPQGTLYGKNAVAGVINIITRQPDNDFRGKVSVDVGENDKKEVALNLSGPIFQDKFFFGLSGQYYDKDGWITNGYTGDKANGQEYWYGKGKLRWTPVDDLDISLTFSQQKYDLDGYNQGLSEAGAASMGLTASGDRKVYSGSDDLYDESTISSQALKVSYKFNDTLNVTSITTHRLFETVQDIDFDYNPVEGLEATADNEEDKISQELRLASTTEKMSWVAGIYYDKDDKISDQTYGSWAIKRDLGGEAYALFGQLRYALTPKIGMTGGLRYETQDKDMQDHATGNSFDDSWDDIAPKFSVDYAITEQVMGYATVAKGFRSGGFNAMSNDSAYNSYDSEELWSYEIGAKSQLLENRLIVNGALFYMDIDSMQVNESFSDGRIFITNAGTAVSYGAELEIIAKITQQFTMTANAGYTKVEFDEYQDAAGDYSNNKVPNVPEYTFAIGGQYRTGNGFYAGVDLVGVGKNVFRKDKYV